VGTGGKVAVGEALPLGGVGVRVEVGPAVELLGTVAVPVGRAVGVLVALTGGGAVR